MTGLALRVRDLGAALALYRDHLGFGLEADPPRYRLPGAPLRPYPSVGLYRFALLTPDLSPPVLDEQLRQPGWYDAFMRGNPTPTVRDGLTAACKVSVRIDVAAGLPRHGLPGTARPGQPGQTAPAGERPDGVKVWVSAHADSNLESSV